MDEYFLFAGLIGAASILFIILAYFYKYVDESEFAEDEDDFVDSLPDDHFEPKSSIKKKDSGKVNEGFLFNTEM